MRIKMLQRVGDHEKDAIVPVEDAVGKRYISAGFAEEAPPEDPTEKFVALMQKQNAGLAAAAAAEVVAHYATKANDPKHPARIRIDAGESESDRRKSFGDQIKWITQAQCPNLFPGKQAEAREHLEKVYGSTFSKFENVTKDLVESSGTTGGYLVKPEYGTELLQLAAEESIVEPYSNHKTLPAKEAFYPMLNQQFTTTGTQDAPQSAYYGGVVMTWLNEIQPGTRTQPAYKQVHINTNELQGLCYLSTFLMDDAFISIDAELRSLFAGALAWAKDFAFLYGNGNAKPKGVVNAPATITYPKRATANSFTLADAANMMGAMMPQSRPKSVWVATNNAFAPIVQLVDGSGRVTYINNVGTGYADAKLASGQTGLLLMGRPVIFTEKLPALGVTGDILLADFSKYITADTGTLQIAASDQYAFNTNEIVYRIIARVDGKPQIDAPFTQQDGTTQISPFVILSSSTS